MAEHCLQKRHGWILQVQLHREEVPLDRNLTSSNKGSRRWMSFP